MFGYNRSHIGILALFCFFSHSTALLFAQINQKNIETLHIVGDLNNLLSVVNKDEFKQHEIVVIIGNTDYCEPCKNLKTLFDIWIRSQKSNPNILFVEFKLTTQPIQNSHLISFLQAEWNSRPNIAENNYFTYYSDIANAQQPTFLIPSIVMLDKYNSDHSNGRKIIIDSDLNKIRLFTSGNFLFTNNGANNHEKLSLPNTMMYEGLNTISSDLNGTYLSNLPVFKILASWLSKHPHDPFAGYSLKQEGDKVYFTPLKIEDHFTGNNFMGFGKDSIKVVESNNQVLIQRCSTFCEVLYKLDIKTFEAILRQNNLTNIDNLNENQLKLLFKDFKE